MKLYLLLLCAISMSSVPLWWSNPAVAAFQTKGGRETPRPTPTPRTDKTRGGSSTRSNTNKPAPIVSKPLPAATLTLIAPAGARIWINDVEVQTSQTPATFMLGKQQIRSSYSPETGTFTLTGIAPGAYPIFARKPDFRDHMQLVDVFLDQENVYRIVLTPLPAKLTVSPSVRGAQVEIFNLETGLSAGPYLNNLEQLEFNPGRYRVTTSKQGYRASIKELVVRPGESVYLEPLLEPLPAPTPTPVPPIASYPMSFSVGRQDKYLILRLQGSSGDAGKTSGSINVTLGGASRNFVTGNLNGLPCRVEFIRLENIAEGSVVEAPGPSNQWATIVVRIRPKDEKRRPISFAINWYSLPGSRP